jgi:hypothetical protein
MNTSTFFSSLKVACLGLLIFTASCKKGPDAIEPGPGQGGSSFAVAGKNLRMTALTMDPAMDIDGDGKVDADLLKILPQCALDNTIKFEGNGKITGSEGADVCPADGDESPTDIKEGTWSYDAKTQILRLNTGGDAVDWKVLTLTGTTLKASLVMDGLDGDNKLNLIMTWQAQ